MKLTFEGPTIKVIVRDICYMLKHLSELNSMPELSATEPANIKTSPAAEAAPVDNPVDIPRDIPVDIPVEKPKPTKTKADKQAAAAKMRAAKEAKKAERAAAAAAEAAPVEIVQDMPMPPPPKTAEGMDPAEVVRLRQQTIEDLQAAYANGREREVYELLARFGEGAKSFRELKPEAFVPIREAIDNGALT